MGHVVELDEEADHVEAVDGPAEVVEVEFYEYDGDGFDEEADSDGEEAFGVTRFDIVIDVFCEFGILWSLFWIIRH